MNDPYNSCLGKPMTQKQEILHIMQTDGSITRAKAADQHIYELSSRIGELEGEGWSFDREYLRGRNKFNRPWRCVRYSNARRA